MLSVALQSRNAGAQCKLVTDCDAQGTFAVLLIRSRYFVLLFALAEVSSGSLWVECRCLVRSQLGSRVLALSDLHDKLALREAYVVKFSQRMEDQTISGCNIKVNDGRHPYLCIKITYTSSRHMHATVDQLNPGTLNISRSADNRRKRPSNGHLQ